MLFICYSGVKSQAIEITSPPDLDYLLWTRDNPRPDEYQIIHNNTLSVNASNFAPSRPTKVLIHGFNGRPIDTWIHNVTREYFLQGDYNIISVDYEALVESPYYLAAVNNAHWVGESVSLLIKFLVSDCGANLRDFHLIGFSLGGQTVSHVGKFFTPTKLQRITGLDPAGFRYYNVHDDQKLSPDDAQFV